MLSFTDVRHNNRNVNTHFVISTAGYLDCKGWCRFALHDCTLLVMTCFWRMTSQVKTKWLGADRAGRCGGIKRQTTAFKLFPWHRTQEETRRTILGSKTALIPRVYVEGLIDNWRERHGNSATVLDVDPEQLLPLTREYWKPSVWSESSLSFQGFHFTQDQNRSNSGWVWKGN